MMNRNLRPSTLAQRYPERKPSYGSMRLEDLEYLPTSGIISMINVGKYSIHGTFGKVYRVSSLFLLLRICNSPNKKSSHDTIPGSHIIHYHTHWIHAWHAYFPPRCNITTKVKSILLAPLCVSLVKPKTLSFEMF